MMPMRKLAAYAVATAVLLGVLTLYANPQMIVALGDMVWACFQ